MYIVEADYQCCICKTVSEHTTIVSFSSYDIDDSHGRDLDTRFRGGLGLRSMIQRCPYCGYCAPDICKPITNALKVGQKSYQAALQNPKFPDLANEFHCLSLLHQYNEELRQAGWASLQAAWVCDDAENSQGAQEFRTRAADFFQKTIGADKRFAANTVLQNIILTDVLRKASQFDEADVYCKIGIEEVKGYSETIENLILEFEEKLIISGDTDTYCTDDVIPPALKLKFSHNNSDPVTRGWFKSIGRKVHTLRNQKGLTIQELASILFIKPDYLIDIEMGEHIDRHHIWLSNIAEYFGVGLDQLTREEFDLN